MYGQQIAKAIFECCDRQIREGSLYPALRGLVVKKLAAKTTEVINGTHRDYYRLTDLGINTLNQINRNFERLERWECTS
jgi:DNA-binding PadR family transcriptional regulator